MRLAGTWKQYSPSAIAQLASTAAMIGADRYFRWPYHATVMNVFETSSKTTVTIEDHVLCRFFGRGVDRSVFGSAIDPSAGLAGFRRCSDRRTTAVSPHQSVRRRR